MRGSAKALILRGSVKSGIIITSTIPDREVSVPMKRVRALTF